MGLVKLNNKGVINVTAVGGSSTDIAVTGGTEEPFTKKFSGGIIQPTGSFAAFEVRQGANTNNQSLPDGTQTTLLWETPEYDFGDNYSNNTSTANANYFQAPVAGLYAFEANILIDDTGDYTNGDRMDLRFYYGTGVPSTMTNFYGFLHIVGPNNIGTNTNQFRTLKGCQQIYLAADERVSVRIHNGTGQTQNTFAANSTDVGAWVRFSGRLVYRTA